MPIAFVADIHLANHRICGGPSRGGINQRASLILQALRSAVRKANDEGCSTFVVLGDLFDVARPSPPLIAAAMRELGEFAGEVHCLLGNHDASSPEEGDHALAPLDVGRVNVYSYDRSTIVSLPDDHYTLLMLPYRSGSASDWFPSAVEDLVMDLPGDGKPLVLCMHLGIHDAEDRKRWGWAAASQDAVSVDLVSGVMQEFAIAYTFAGNWHNWAEWRDPKPIVQVGSLAPTGWDNPGFDHYGHLAILNSSGVVKGHVGGPRFVTVHRHQELVDFQRMAKEKDCSLFVRWEIKHADDALIVRACLGDEDLAGFVVNIASGNKEEVRSTLSEMRRDGSILGFLHEYVESLDLADSKKEVFNRAKSYLILR